MTILLNCNQNQIGFFKVWIVGIGLVRSRLDRSRRPSLLKDFPNCVYRVLAKLDILLQKPSSGHCNIWLIVRVNRQGLFN